jgi:hypothetical protein
MEIGSTRVITEVTKESYSSLSPPRRKDVISSSSNGLAMVAKVSTNLVNSKNI